MEEKAKKICLIIVSVIVVQFLCRYYSKHFVSGHGFHVLIFMLRIGVPILIATLYLKISWEDLGISIPEISKTGLLWFAGTLFLIPVCLYLIKINPSYQDYYRSYTGSSGDVYVRFAVFTFSTLSGWEFMHRGYLLFSLKKLLAEEELKGSANHLSEQTASVIALLIVMVFETLYHFIKPDMEAFGMLIASPILSLIALRTKSILIPMLIHFYVEAWFILYITA